MYVMNLVDVVDYRINYGFLLCNNDSVAVNEIQIRICELIEEYENEQIEWTVVDIVNMLPKDWQIEFQSRVKNIVI